MAVSVLCETATARLVTVDDQPYYRWQVRWSDEGRQRRLGFSGLIEAALFLQRLAAKAA